MLRGQAAYGHPAFGRGLVAGDEPAEQIEQPAILEAASQPLAQHGMRDAIEVSANVELEKEIAPPREFPSPLDRRDPPLAAPAGECVVDQEPVEFRLAHVHDRMMHNAVAKARRRDQALLGIVDRELMIRAGGVGLFVKLPRQILQVPIQSRGEKRGVALGSLAAGRLPERQSQVIPLDHPLHQPPCALHRSHPGAASRTPESAPRTSGFGPLRHRRSCPGPPCSAPPVELSAPVARW